jgi:arylsulfatase A-like enzyme
VKSRRDRPNASGSQHPRFELYNLREDVEEKNDLAETQPEKLKELLARYDELEKQVVPASRSDPNPEDFQPPRIWGE